MKNKNNIFLKRWRIRQREKGQCLDCIAPVEDGQGRCKKHRDAHTKRENERRKRKKRLGICRACDKKVIGKLYCPFHAQKANVSAKISWRKLRDTIIRAYGNACACCGTKEQSFLSIDHIMGGGREHRRRLGNSGTIYRWLKKKNFPKGYQVLCHNCNRSKYFLGVCAHQKR